MNLPPLSSLALSWKILVTGFVILLGSGYLAAVLNAALSVGLTPAAIADHYADKRLSETERRVIEERGFVEETFSLDDLDEEDDITMEAMDHGAMVAHAGTHDAIGGDDTLPPRVLAQVSHVHLLSFSILLLGAGGLACLTRLKERTKAVVVGVLFISLWGDIVSLNLVRFVSADFAYLTMIMGAVVGICFAFISLRVLWELWLTEPELKNHRDAVEASRTNTHTDPGGNDAS